MAIVLVFGLLVVVGAMAWYLLSVALPDVPTIWKVGIGAVVLVVLGLLSIRGGGDRRR